VLEKRMLKLIERVAHPVRGRPGYCHICLHRIENAKC
jgi:hypothetical protein